MNMQENWNLPVTLIVFLENVAKGNEAGRVIPWIHYRKMIFEIYKVKLFIYIWILFYLLYLYRIIQLIYKKLMEHWLRIVLPWMNIYVSLCLSSINLEGQLRISNYRK